MKKICGLAIALLALPSGCALAYYVHAKEDKLRTDAMTSTRCQDVEILEHDDENARVRACGGAVWSCHFNKLTEPTGPLSTHHGQWVCEL
ncbi:MAG: hypothetical protein ABIJ09_05325 [Pseudomonadota bacterium]